MNLADLAGKLDSIEQKVEETRKAAVHQAAVCDTTRPRLDELERSLGGNSRPGLVEDMAEVKATLKTLRWVAWLTATVVGLWISIRTVFG